MLKGKNFDHVYSSFGSNTPMMFCLQALSESVKLDLGLGYFSSGCFNVLALGMARFIANGGCMNLYINKYVSAEDYSLLKGDYDHKYDEELAISFSQLKQTFQQRDEHFFKCLAYLIEHGRINVKIVMLTGGGLPHEKYGIFTDEDGHKIHFSGSMNMTASAILSNLEFIECTCSWKGEDSLDKIINLEKHFQRIWNEQHDGVRVYNAKYFCNEIMKTYPTQDPEMLLQKEEEFIGAYLPQFSHTSSIPDFPRKYRGGARPYQEEAYKAWVDNGKQGVFAMATGTGKTVTALNCALHEYSEDGFYNLLILVPSLDLVAQWQEELREFNFNKTINVSSINSSWRKELVDIHEKVERKKTVNYAIISTYRSFVDPGFQLLLPVLSERMILIADEAHNIGGEQVKSCFECLSIRRRIALSATPERIYDEEGSQAIASFFNDAYPYVYSFPMSKAIEEGRLCQYFYYPKLAYLDESEMELYRSISKKLAGLWDSNEGKFRNKQEADMLLMQRKRIVHKCADKLRVFREIISEIGEESLKYTFVYAPQGRYEKVGEDEDNCDDIAFIQKLLDETRAVYPHKRCNRIIGDDSREQRACLLTAFADGTIDILFAMKCLDEGVDVPRAEYGIFTSSTGNPREFIQRRGRLLRNHPDKRYSKIYDIIVVPSCGEQQDLGRIEQNLLRSELKRVAYFADLAMNNYANGGAFEVLQGVANRFEIGLAELLDSVEQ